ncbi:MAG: hypothetical protein V1495_02360 [Pseudomonadota bacterium]
MAKRKKKVAKKSKRTKAKKAVSKKKRHPKGKKRVARKAASKAKKRPATRNKVAKKRTSPRKLIARIVTGAVAAGAASAVRSTTKPEPNLRKPASGSPRPARVLDDFDTSKKDLLGGFGDEPGFADEETSNYGAEETEESDEEEEEEDEEESFSEDLTTRKTPLTSRPYFRGEEE